jgi:hypothetical protein
MPSVHACPLPDAALLRAYQRDGAYADCWVAEVAWAVPQAEFVEAFYTTAAFRIERRLLAWGAQRPSTDAQARELAVGRRTTFAAWNVEGRAADQLLLADMTGRTRSWLMSMPAATPGTTRLYFGSAVVARVDRRTGAARMGFAFSALLGFHKLYSRVLLRAAVARLARRRAAQG